jgi:hypothetical protein
MRACRSRHSSQRQRNILVLNEVIIALMRKGVASDGEGHAPEAHTQHVFTLVCLYRPHLANVR